MPRIENSTTRKDARDPWSLYTEEQIREAEYRLTDWEYTLHKEEEDYDPRNTAK